MTDLKKNVPELRFPEFSGEWEEMPLEKLCTFSNGINAKKEQYGHGRKFINVLDILNKNYITYDEIIGAVSVSEETEQRNKVEYGDLLFLRSSETREEVGTSNVYLDDRFALYGGFVIRGKKIAEYDPMFIKNLLNTGKIRSVISAASGGSTRYNVNQEILKKLKLKLTKIKEQQKIGNFFSKLDRQIELEEQKLALLEQQKKGYMQKIFSQELRFKDDNGNDYPEWEDKQLSSFLQIRNNKQIPNEEAPLMSFTSTGGIEAKGDRYNREFLVKDKNKMYKKTELYDLIYSSNNLDVGAIGLNRYGEAVISDVYEIFSIKSSFSPYYVELAIIQPKFINNILKFRQGALYGQYRIHAKDFLKLKIKLPYELEQQKIGDFFNKLDQLIEKQSHKVDLLKQRKKGLLQKMFV
ncbi:hypothetical protein B5C01_08630 [Staphylococcus delphini]|uniref:Type I restriction modification DNA specificity domain-containing protein n=1 Tax=Staphylococcus delphini TaxID=53344 RepID=A0A2A4GWG9_9STAP|nr:restriction endonuclease subunit S [Staphylococcus delphini]PCF54648.1 hypothetical protein B5C08_09235 [Staphylococcus delphini]PCF61377.1 hypothetical protein B5C01_08630 [Staphylococcus delphini]HEC2158051.1 restriction endonuclease subunit S [Staphylococcus delphini]